jgi:hypothetical protein
MADAAILRDARNAGPQDEANGLARLKTRNNRYASS